MKIRFKKMHPDAVMPKRAHESDAGYDLTAVSMELDADGNVSYDTGIAVEIPVGYAGFVYPRSSISKKSLVLTNSVGIIDSGYRGSISVKFKLACNWDGMKPGNNLYRVGERVAQLIIIPVFSLEFEGVDELSESDRGVGGYGSTGK